MTWLNRGFKIRHKFIKEKDMKAEAIQALELFKQQHLAKAVNEQADMVSESSDQTKENQMEERNLGELLSTWEEGEKVKQKSFNYPDHIKPLKDRIMSALKNGARTVESVSRYCNENEKLINLQLNRWVSRGQIGKHIVPSSGNVKYYPYDIAKEMGILIDPKPINYWTKERKDKAQTKKRSSSVVDRPAQEPSSIPNKPTTTQETQYIAFLEKRIIEWQTEARKMANQIIGLEKEVIKAKTEPRNVTGEVQEVMQEVMELRGTVAYLESKLFGSK
jgi:hypothetical protein